jgi:NAD(P)-dependent dehydrogenase (short-subunit alcohol dehydrogenase family)
MDRVKEKVAIITGGASGIGRATAELFASEGAAVAILDINDDAGTAAAAEIQKKGGNALYIHCDVTRAGECQSAVQTCADRFGRLDILFNNAGVIRRTNVVDTSEPDWDWVMAVNVKSAFLMSKYAIPYLAQGGGGVIIHTSSGWGLRGGRNAASYCASKGALVNLTRAMAIDHGHQNIRVNCICPGDTDTPMLRSEAEQLGQALADFMEEAAERPLRRYAQPAEIAEAVLYLASDAAGYITGTALVIDGGGLA